MSNSLATYLQDHLAGSVHAIDLVEHIRRQHAAEELGDFCTRLLIEINADKEVLQQLAERTGGGSSSLKEMGAWFAEKMARLKLGQSAGNDLATLEALEFLQLGITGKLSLWTALAEAVSVNPALQGLDYNRLAERARSQIAQVDERRLQAARLAMSKP